MATTRLLDPLVARLGPPGARPPTTVQVGQGSVAGSGSVSQTQRLLALIGQVALKAGLGAEGAKVAQAIAVTEGGLTGAVGDLAGGGSYGPFQFYAQGQLPNFAAAIGAGTEDAKKVIARNPEVAVEWALRGYLGDAIRRGQQKGLVGPALATFAQRHGQVSESPERAGMYYQQLFKGVRDQPLGLTVDPAAPAPRTGPDPDLVPNQLTDRQLTWEEAVAACGPAAAIAFAKKWGRTPSLRDVLNLAKTTGWTPGGGMNGMGNQVRLLEEMDIPHRLAAGAPDWKAVIHDAMNGNPVILSTPVHYWVIDGYDPATHRFHVGNSGVVRSNVKKAWVTAQEIYAADGQIDGALYAEFPLTPGNSVATRKDTGNRDDWRLTSRPTANRGAGTSFRAGAEQSEWTGDGVQREPYDPYQTEGWRQIQGMRQRFWQNAAQSNASFLEQAEEAPAIARRAMVAPSVVVPYRSTFEGLLDPKRGTPLQDFTAPPVGG